MPSKYLFLRNLSKAEKERLRAVRESAASGGLKVGGVTTDAVAQMMLLQVQCRTANGFKTMGRGCVTPISFCQYDVLRLLTCLCRMH